MACSSAVISPARSTHCNCKTAVNTRATKHQWHFMKCPPRKNANCRAAREPDHRRGKKSAPAQSAQGPKLPPPAPNDNWERQSAVAAPSTLLPCPTPKRMRHAMSRPKRLARLLSGKAKADCSTSATTPHHTEAIAASGSVHGGVREGQS